MSAVLISYTNTEDGMTAEVTKHAKGFAVALRDDDSGEYLDHVLIFPSLEAADAKAIEVLGP